MVDRVGQQFGNYCLIRLLGRGGFAQVYLAEHVRLGTKAAIKILYAHLQDAQIRAFQQEARTIAELKHAHIIRVLDFDVQEGTPFLVLDYAEQGSLRQKHPKGSLVSLDLVIKYVQQIASGLQFAHQHKLIHRDVKPENVLIGEDGHLLLSDFGIATIAHSTSSMGTDAAMGTLAYMAPEQIQGKPRKESDQYALAVMVFEFLTGHLPFGGSSAEIIAQHLGAPPPPLQTPLPDLPPEVEQVVLTALAKDPQQRFGSIGAFANALAQACGLAKAALPLLLTPSGKSGEPAPDVTTMPVSLAVEVADPQRSYTPPAQPVLTPPLSSSPTRPPQSQRSTPISKPRRWIMGTLISGLVLLLVIGSVLWFTRPEQKQQGDGTENSPYRLSAENTSVQNIGIALTIKDTSPASAVCPIPTVVSLQKDGSQTQFNFSWQGLDSTQQFQWEAPHFFILTNNGATYNGPSYYATTTSPPPLYTLEFAVSPQAGQEWWLDMLTLVQQNATPNVPTRSICDYNPLFLQF